MEFNLNDDGNDDCLKLKNAAIITVNAQGRHRKYFDYMLF